MTPKAITCLFYIDDDSDDLDFFSLACDDLGESVRLFNLPEAFFNSLQNPPPKPSIIFLDLNMPLVSGFEIIEELRRSKSFSEVPIIIYSTAADTKTVAQCRELGASMYVIKPTSLKLLKEVIKFVIDIDWENHTINDENFLYQFS